MRATEFIVEYKEYPTQEYEGVTFTMKEKDGQLIVKPLNDYGISMGHVVFNMDGKILDPQDLVIADKYQGQGIAKVMYDYIKSQGFTIERSWDQTDAGAGFWNKHRGEDVRVWESELDEAFDAPYPMTWEHGDESHDALVKLPDGTNLSIMFSLDYGHDGDPEWHVEFWRNNSQDVTGKGDSQRIFATVLSAIQQFIRFAKPRYIQFSASKETDDGERNASRSSLYTSLVKRYASSWGYKVAVSDLGISTVFKLRKMSGVNEGTGLNYIGNCTDDDVVEHLFGDATGFAQAVDEYGDEFVLDDLVVKYDPETDVHSFYYKQGDLEEGWKDWVAGAAMGAAALGAHGDAEAATKKHQVNKPAVVQQVKMQKVTPEQSRGGESPADLKAYVEAMAKKYLPANQVPQFIGQVAHETANFTSMIEQNPEKNLIHYAKAKNPLGNKGMLDAQKYIGRGFLQITGKYNYKHFGDKIRPGFGDELLKNPDLAMRKDVAIALAVYFWRERVAHKIDAGAGNKEIATAINGRKPKGLDSRAQAVKMAAANFPTKKRG